MNPDLRHFRYFLAVAEERSFTRAARRLHMSQPPLSHAVKALENHFGIPLLRRSTRQVELTAAGEVLAEEARGVLDRWETALHRLNQLARVTATRLVIGFRAASGYPFVQQSVALFRRRLPAARIELRHVEWADQTTCLRTGRADLSFITAPADYAGLRTAELCTVPRLACLPADHPLAARNALSINDLQDLPVVHPTNASVGYVDFWTASPRPDGRRAVPGPTAGSTDEMLALVAIEHAVAFVPGTLAECCSRSDLAFVPVKDLEPARIMLAWAPEPRGVLCEAFADAALQAVRGTRQRLPSGS